MAAPVKDIVFLANVFVMTITQAKIVENFYVTVMEEVNVDIIKNVYVKMDFTETIVKNQCVKTTVL